VMSSELQLVIDDIWCNTKFLDGKKTLLI